MVKPITSALRCSLCPVLVEYNEASILGWQKRSRFKEPAALCGEQGSSWPLSHPFWTIVLKHHSSTCSWHASQLRLQRHEWVFWHEIKQDPLESLPQCLFFVRATFFSFGRGQKKKYQYQSPTAGTPTWVLILILLTVTEICCWREKWIEIKNSEVLKIIPSY